MGKGARQLSDDAVLQQQLGQLEELNERRLQIEMIMEWRNELLSMDSLKAEKIGSILKERTGMGPNEHGVESIEKWVRKFPFDMLAQATDQAIDAHFSADAEDVATAWNEAFNRIPVFAVVLMRSKDNPQYRDFAYIRGILRNRLNHVREDDVMWMLESAADAGLDLEHFKEVCKGLNTWREFEQAIFEYLDSHEIYDA